MAKGKWNKYTDSNKTFRHQLILLRITMWKRIKTANVSVVLIIKLTRLHSNVQNNTRSVRSHVQKTLKSAPGWHKLCTGIIGTGIIQGAYYLKRTLFDFQILNTTVRGFVDIWHPPYLKIFVFRMLNKLHWMTANECSFSEKCIYIKLDCGITDGKLKNN